MKLNVTNDPQTEYYIVVESDEKIQDQWRRAFEDIPHSEPFITDDINEALCAWSRFFMNNLVPRCVIVDWNIGLGDVCETVGGINRAGTHFFLHYCVDLSPEGVFIIYTDQADAAVKDMQGDTVVGPHATIVRKDRYSPSETLKLISDTPVFQRQASGHFHL